ncbi:MAG: restriction endonuclease subunit S [Alphaproteobacteria bacterium]
MAVEGWEITTVSELGDVVTGKTPSTKNQNFWGGNIPFVTPTDMNSSKYIVATERFVTGAAMEKVTKPLPQGSVMVTCIASIGKMAIAERKCITNQQINTIIPNKQVVSEFLYYALLSKAPELKNMSGTTAVPIINKTQFSKVEVDLPPLPEQKKIAEVLGSVDEAIAKTEAVIAQTQRVKQGLLQTLLTRGIGHTKFKQTELGEIPESWEIKPIGDMVEFSNGKAHEKDIDEKGEYVVVNSKFISTEGKVRKFSHSLNLPASINDILIVMSDIPNGKAIAKCFLTDIDNTYTVNQRIGRLRPKRDNPSFLYYVLNRNPYFLSFDDGVKQTNLRKDEVLACPIAAPTNTQEQDGIVNVLDGIGDTVSSNINKLAELKKLKKGLMADLLTGRVRVNVDQNTKEDAA